MIVIDLQDIKLFGELVTQAGAVMIEKLGKKAKEEVDKMNPFDLDPEEWVKMFQHGWDSVQHQWTEGQKEQMRRKQQVYQMIRRMEQRLPELTNFRVTCPEDGCSPNVALKTVIILLNDVHGWSRESIADWVEGLNTDLKFPTPDEGGDAQDEAGDSN